MKKTDILMSGPMVRATLERRKRKTRRPLIPQPPPETTQMIRQPDGSWRPAAEGGFTSTLGFSPFARVGDRLRVRENFRLARAVDDLKPREAPKGSLVFYEADRDGDLPPWAGRLRPSIFLPAWASRAMIEVTSIDVERLGSITNSEARDEGFLATDRGSESDEFRNLWDSLNARRGFSIDSRPWVWVIGFEVAT